VGVAGVAGIAAVAGIAGVAGVATAPTKTAVITPRRHPPPRNRIGTRSQTSNRRGGR
jgi:hypothetical protein